MEMDEAYDFETEALAHIDSVYRVALWFYAVPAPAAGTDRFRLAGGRPSYIHGQPIACFYYRGAGNYASLFVVPLERLQGAARRFAAAPEVDERDPHRIAYWRQGAYAYLLVSDAPVRDMLPLAAALRSS